MELGGLMKPLPLHLLEGEVLSAGPGWGQPVLAWPERSRSPAGCAKWCQSVTGFHSASRTGGCGYRTRNILGKAVETYGAFSDATDALIDFVQCCWIIFDLLNTTSFQLTVPEKHFFLSLFNL